MATKFFIIILLLFCSCPSLANTGVNWNLLNLSDWQKTEINNLNSSWQKTSMNLSKQIIYDQNILKTFLSNPLSSDQDIIKLQNKILLNQNKLSIKAMENFLQKRSLLNALQRQRLHKILSN